jgi:cytochrome d ubiquinol oxidase subunit I
MVIVGIVFTPLQIILGDASGLEVAKNEPTKSAAMEAHWDTNPPGEGAPWVVIAWPDQAAQKNSWEITIHDGLSVLNTHSLKGQVEGLRAFPVNDQPPVALPFYAFRLMVLLGIVMVVLILAALWLWIRKKLRLETLTGNRLFWNAWIYAIPFGFIATWCGWVVREVGRQPWVVYDLMRTSDGVSPNIADGTVVASLILFIFIYVALFGAFIYFTRRILMQGPDLDSPLPKPKNRRV